MILNPYPEVHEEFAARTRHRVIARADREDRRQRPARENGASVRDFGRVTKAHILAAVRDALGDEAAAQIADKKKVEMAEAAEQLLAGTGWLPPVLRTAQPAWLDEQADTFALETVEPAPSQEANDDHFTIAAE